MDDIERILKNSDKAELIECLSEALQKTDKCIIVVIQDKEDGTYSSQVITLGVFKVYEALGILESGKQDIIEDWD